MPKSYTLEATVSVVGDPTPGNNTYSGYVVNALSPSIGGAITAPASVCTSGNAGTLTMSGHTGSILGWQYSTDGGGTWINLSNASTTQSYNNITVATKYRTQVQNGACTPVYSDVSTITIDPVSVGGNISGSTTVCKTANAGSVTASGARVGAITKWQYSTNGGANYRDTVAVLVTSLGYLNLAGTTVYRLEAKSGGCPAVYSTTATVTVSPETVGGTVNASATVCSGTNGATLTLSGHTGTVSKWESSIDGACKCRRIGNSECNSV